MSKRGEAWLKVIRVVTSIEADLSEVLQTSHRLGLSEFRALEALSKSPNGELRMQELASHLRLNQSSVSRMVERLERTGLTVRDLCPDDKRGVYSVLTKEGKALFEAARLDYEQTLLAAIKKHGGEKLLSAI